MRVHRRACSLAAAMVMLVLVGPTLSGCGRAERMAATTVRAATAGPAAGCARRMTLSVTASFHIGVGAGALTTGGGSVWVANARQGTVTEVTGSSTRVIRLGGAPVSLASGYGHVWVARRDADSVAGIPYGGGRPLISDLIPTPVSIASGPHGVYVVSLDASALYAVDTVDARIGVPIYSPVPDPVAVAESGDDMWLLGAGDGGVSPIDVELYRVVRYGFHLPGRALAGLSGGDGEVWLAEPTRHALLRVLTASVDVHEFPLGGGIVPVATGVGSCGIWVGGEDGQLLLIDPATGAPMASTLRVGASVAAVAPDGTGVWVSDPVDGRLLYVSARPAG